MVNERQFKDGVKAYPLTPRSFGDLVGGSISGGLQIYISDNFIFHIYHLSSENQENETVLG